MGDNAPSRTVHLPARSARSMGANDFASSRNDLPVRRSNSAGGSTAMLGRHSMDHSDGAAAASGPQGQGSPGSDALLRRRSMGNRPNSEAAAAYWQRRERRRSVREQQLQQELQQARSEAANATELALKLLAHMAPPAQHSSLLTTPSPPPPPPPPPPPAPLHGPPAQPELQQQEQRDTIAPLPSRPSPLEMAATTIGTQAFEDLLLLDAATAAMSLQDAWQPPAGLASIAQSGMASSAVHAPAAFSPANTHWAASAAHALPLAAIQQLPRQVGSLGGATAMLAAAPYAPCVPALPLLPPMQPGRQPTATSAFLAAPVSPVTREQHCSAGQMWYSAAQPPRMLQPAAGVNGSYGYAAHMSAAPVCSSMPLHNSTWPLP